MEPDGSRIWIYVLLILVFALLKGVYTACEYAVTEVNDSKVKTLAETDPRYAKLLKLIEAPQKMMLAFSMQRALSCVMISILAVMLLDAVLDTIGARLLGMIPADADLPFSAATGNIAARLCGESCPLLAVYRP